MPTTREQFEALLTWLSPDSGRAEQEYVRVHERLKNFFKYETFAALETDKLADDTLDVVAEKLVSSRLSNAGSDILDMRGLCARLSGKSGRDSHDLCTRLMDFLPESGGEIVRAVARIADFQRRGSPLFCPGDLKDLKRLARRLLNEGSALSAYLCEQLTQDVRQQLREFCISPAAPESLEKNLAGELNRLITERRLLEVGHFARLTSENHLMELAGPSPQQDDHVRINRMLLEKTFPDEIAKSGRHPARLSKALNSVLARRDLFRPADFEAVAHADGAGELLANGRDSLSQADVERLNRLILGAAFPGEIAPRLIDRQYEDKWPYFEKTARNVYLKHARRIKEVPTDLETSTEAAKSLGGSLQEIEDFFGKIESSREYKCLMDCCRMHHAECLLVARYYQAVRDGVVGAVGRKSKDDRKEMAEGAGVSSGVVKTRVHRAKVKLRSCVTDCLSKLIQHGRRSAPA